MLLLRGIPAAFHDRLFYGDAVTTRNRRHSGACHTGSPEDDRWVDGPSFYETGAWLPDGKGIYYISEADKWGHLYW
jgi:hypothetical protein